LQPACNCLRLPRGIKPAAISVWLQEQRSPETSQTALSTTTQIMMCCTTLLALLLEEQKARELADKSVRHAAPTGDKYMQLLAEGVRHATKQDWHRAASSCRAAIALRPDEPVAYYNLGATLGNSGHHVEAAHRFLEAKERFQVGSKSWAVATADAFETLRLKECGEVAKPEWWNDRELRALSVRVVTAAPDGLSANKMRARVLSGHRSGAWEAGPRNSLRLAADLREAAKHFGAARVLRG
jgi:tetratricopeptide (TPR) repeat protein